GAFLPTRGLEDVPGARQAGRVRARRLHAGRRATRLHDEHRRAGAAGGGQRAAEASAIQQAFHVDADRLGLGLVDQVLDEVADLEVDLVAEGHAVAEADGVGSGTVEYGD